MENYLRITNLWLNFRMSRILVSGLINIETTLRVDGFPIEYNPVNYPFFGVNSSVAGVGYNIAKALTGLGDEPVFLSLIGTDAAGSLVRMALAADQIEAGGVLEGMPHTAQSVILYDEGGRRQIYTDLKDIQERTYPPERFEAAAADCEWLALCNINFSRPMLAWAQRAGKAVASDVHTIHDLDDPYNCDFMQAARVLFMSDESLPVSPEEWALRIWERFGTEIVVIGLGAQGALLAVRQERLIQRFPAVYTRPIVNTIGAGDALFSAFLHAYVQSGDPIQSLRKAIVFASYKIGVATAADGFLSEAELDRWFKKV
jgi:sugar/nucleoside kinase (ribokinase family)